MLLKLFTILKRGRKAFHDGVLLRCKPVRVCRINGGEIPVQHLLLAAFQQYGPPVQINAVQQVSAIQAEFRMFPDDLALHLELDNGYGLVHPDIQFRLAGAACVGPLELETGARIASIGIQGKGCQRQQINAVTVLQDIQIAVSGTDADYICNTSLLTGSRTHPQHIMVPPLDIQGMIGHQLVHNHVGPRPPVIYISQYM